MQKNSKTKKPTHAKDRYKYTTGQLFNFARDSYLERTSRPVYAIVFLLPFIVFYEIGTILINTDVLSRLQVRVVAFVWLQNALEYLGPGTRLAWVAPPLVVVAILIGLQVASRKRWSFVLSDIPPMAVECVLLAVPLIVFSLFLNTPASPPRQDQPVASMPAKADSLPCCAAVSSDALASSTVYIPDNVLASIVTGIGAGIYEELVFRLILICLLMLLFQDAVGLNHTSSVILSVLISAALFSAHHHVAFVDGRLGQIAAFNWTEFGFRTMAGIYFAVLFAIRGFGITAGTHAFYDILATIVNAFFLR